MIEYNLKHLKDQIMCFITIKNKMVITYNEVIKIIKLIIKKILLITPKFSYLILLIKYIFYLLLISQ